MIPFSNGRYPPGNLRRRAPRPPSGIRRPERAYQRRTVPLCNGRKRTDPQDALRPDHPEAIAGLQRKWQRVGRDLLRTIADDDPDCGGGGGRRRFDRCGWWWSRSGRRGYGILPAESNGCGGRWSGLQLHDLPGDDRLRNLDRGSSLVEFCWVSK